MNKTLPDSPFAKFAAMCPPTEDPWALPCTWTSRNPWIEPPEVTPELEALADALDAGGRELIADVERD